MSPKARSIALLVLAEVAAMSLWFSAAAVLPDMLSEAALAPWRQAALTSGVQAGFVIGALLVAASGLADRLDPRRVFAIAAVLAAAANFALLVVPVGGASAIALRVATGVLMAGIYPVGMKIAAGWGLKDRGLLLGLLIGALTLGSAVPHLFSFLGGADWRHAIAATAALALLAGLIALAVGLGPHHARSARFDPGAIRYALTTPAIRLNFFGYFGHMWELYALWAWIGVAAAASYAGRLEVAEAESLAKLTAFLGIGLGAFACVYAGRVADRIGKARVTILVMAASGTMAVATALAFGGPVWLSFLFFVTWGILVAPDSAQFSALVADIAPPERTGSLLTLQTALGFLLTVLTVQATPVLAEALGWAPTLGLLALGPAFGALSMYRLERLQKSVSAASTCRASRGC